MRQKVFAYVVRERGCRPELLVFRCPLEPGFEVPKGSIEPGERPEEAVLREVAEESGLAAAIRRSLGAAVWVPPWDAPAEEQHFFLLAPAGPAPDSWVHEVGGDGPDAGERYAFQWLALDGAPDSLLVQGAARMLGALRAALAV
ncbi:MAG TPA: NUDIX domain-containing protein [Herpetosiphonaceae bacterium]